MPYLFHDSLDVWQALDVVHRRGSVAPDDLVDLLVCPRLNLRERNDAAQKGMQVDR